MYVLAFDAGHGGRDCGACNYNLNQNEKTWTRKTVDKVKSIMEATGQFKIIDCRPGDSNPDLYQRALNAKNGGAVYMCSFHLNAANKQAYGAEVIAPAKEKVAATENALKKAATDNGFTWRKIYTRDYNTGANYNKGISGDIFTDVYQFTDYYGICRHAWALGISADIFEMAFIDNDADMTKFMNNHDAYCKSIAKQLAAAYGVSIDGTTVSKPATPSTPKPSTPKPATPKPSTPTTTGSTKYKVGTAVCTNHIWKSSTDNGAGYSGQSWEGKITRVIPGAAHPYLLNDGNIGWTDDKSIDSDPNLPGGGKTQTSSKPASSGSKGILVLPASASSWNVYPLDKAPVVGNQCGRLLPSKFGGLTYQILAKPQANVVTIQTEAYGKVNIYVGPETGAIIK